MTLFSNSRAQDKGFLPSGLVNFVALLGWNPADGNNQEIFQMKELKTLVRKAGVLLFVLCEEIVDHVVVFDLFGVVLD